MNLRKIKDKKGSVSIEYIVIVLMVVGVVFGAILLMGRGIKTSIKESNEHLKSSSASKEIGQVYDNTGNERHDGGSESEGYGNDSVWEDEYGGITPGGGGDTSRKYNITFTTDGTYKFSGEYGTSLTSFSLNTNDSKTIEMNGGTPVKVTYYKILPEDEFIKWNIDGVNARVNGNTIVFLVEDDATVSVEIEPYIRPQTEPESFATDDYNFLDMCAKQGSACIYNIGDTRTETLSNGGQIVLKIYNKSANGLDVAIVNGIISGHPRYNGEQVGEYNTNGKLGYAGDMQIALGNFDTIYNNMNPTLQGMIVYQNLDGLNRKLHVPSMEEANAYPGLSRIGIRFWLRTYYNTFENGHGVYHVFYRHCDGNGNITTGGSTQYDGAYMMPILRIY